MSGEATEPDPADAARRAQERMAFILGLRAKGIADVAVLRALETAPREIFVPRRHVDLALRDVALPIPCGQTMPEPYLVARMMEALQVRPQHRVLEIGAGSGYATAVLAQLAKEVVSYERFRSLALEAQMRLRSLGVANARVEWEDGLANASEGGLFDRILVHGIVDEPPPASLVEALAEGGLIVAARRGEDGRRLVRFAHRDGGFVVADVAPCRLGPLQAGKSAGM
ncbi:MAG TPA: rRNA adenine N-6-methyltransferase family protein [Beijerinckiaceae bacterium]